jgi:hypothetical protein
MEMFIYHQENANYFENSTFSLLEDYCSHHVPMIAQMFPPLDCWFNPPSKILYRKLHYCIYIYTYTHTHNQIYTYTYYIYIQQIAYRNIHIEMYIHIYICVRKKK